MGASSSKTSVELQNEITSTALNTCESAGAVNSVIFKNVDINPPESCPSSEVYIEQSATVSAECAISSLQTATVDAAMELETTAEAGLGFAVTSSHSDTLNALNLYVENQCEAEDAVDYVNWEDVTFNACNLYIVQNATANSQCQIEQTQGQLALVTTEAVSESEGMGWGGILLIIGAVIAAIIGIIILIVVGKTLMNKGNSGSKVTIQTAPAPAAAPVAAPVAAAAPTGAPPPVPARPAKTTTTTTATTAATPAQVGGACDSDSTPYVFLIIGGILIVIAYMFSGAASNQRQVTSADLDHFNQNLMQTRQIARLDNTGSDSAPTRSAIDQYNHNHAPAYTPDYYDFTGVSDFSERSDSSQHLTPSHSRSTQWFDPMYDNYRAQVRSDSSQTVSPRTYASQPSYGNGTVQSLDDFYRPLL